MGCKEEKTLVSISGSYPHYEKDELLKERPLVFKGIVTKKGESYMRNPDGTLTNEYGGPITNYQTTEYTIQIQELYKGSYAEETIILKINNGYGLNADLILYGEDETTKLAEKPKFFELTVGEEYIFTPAFITSKDPRFEGYQVSQQSAFAVTSDGSFANSNGEKVSPDTIRQEITAAAK